MYRRTDPCGKLHMMCLKSHLSHAEQIDDAANEYNNCGSGTFTSILVDSVYAPIHDV